MLSDANGSNQKIIGIFTYISIHVHINCFAGFCPSKVFSSRCGAAFVTGDVLDPCFQALLKRFGGVPRHCLNMAKSWSIGSWFGLCLWIWKSGHMKIAYCTTTVNDFLLMKSSCGQKHERDWIETTQKATKTNNAWDFWIKWKQLRKQNMWKFGLGFTSVLFLGRDLKRLRFSDISSARMDITGSALMIRKVAILGILAHLRLDPEERKLEKNRKHSVMMFFSCVLSALYPSSVMSFFPFFFSLSWSSSLLLLLQYYHDYHMVLFSKLFLTFPSCVPDGKSMEIVDFPKPGFPQAGGRFTWAPKSQGGE